MRSIWRELERALTQAGLDPPSRVHIRLIPEDDARGPSNARLDCRAGVWGARRSRFFPRGYRPIRTIRSSPSCGTRSSTWRCRRAPAVARCPGGSTKASPRRSGPDGDSPGSCACSGRRLRSPALSEVTALFESDAQPGTARAYLLVGRPHRRPPATAWAGRPWRHRHPGGPGRSLRPRLRDGNRRNRERRHGARLGLVPGAVVLASARHQRPGSLGRNTGARLRRTHRPASPARRAATIVGGLIASSRDALRSSRIRIAGTAIAITHPIRHTPTARHVLE